MDRGEQFGLRRLLRFNGHFFHRAEVLPLGRADLAVLEEAAARDWREVEPTIFGTLLTRALDPVERHRLGAEYTPRAYVERVVRQAVDVPIRERWALVQAEVLPLKDSRLRKDRHAALGKLRDFHGWLRGLRVLDPACGSGNFLYVALFTIKRVELEVLREIESFTGNPELAVEEVGPWQFHGIEVKPWAREIAELTLWIGHHQFWMEHHKGTNPPEPVLQDTRTLELRDAVLAWDEIVEVPEKSRPDPTPRKLDPVTGKLVPDPNARLPYYEYRGARQAPWPRVDFIVGNPPYMGRGRQRDAFGDGYVDALRRSYPQVPDNADYVIHWWYRAAEAVATGHTIRAGLITTSTITQRHNRAIIEQARIRGGNVIWAAPDHPWVDEVGGAAVRVAMSVIARDSGQAKLVEVDDSGTVIRESTVTRINDDLSATADVATAADITLQASVGLSSQGFTLVGDGFRLSPEEGRSLRAMGREHLAAVKPIMSGRDLATQPRGIYTIDFGLRTEIEARSMPVLFEIVRSRVKPGRDANNDRSTREKWWLFGRNREQLRAAIIGLERYIVTVETSKHRTFQFLAASTAAEHSVVCIALEDAFSLGVLSSKVHLAWALATGGRLGVGNDPRYQKALTFDPFPFPIPSPALRVLIADVAERLDRHRKDAIARDERVTMTGMYNVVEKLRSGEALTPRERDIHVIAACGVLRDLHDELDALVAEAYGWPWPMEREEILERLVALHDERVEEEKRGIVRWLRPDYQIPRFGKGTSAPSLSIPQPEAEAEPDTAPALVTRRPWPGESGERLSALMALVAAAPVTAQKAAAAFDGAPPAQVRAYLEALVLVGEVRPGGDGRYQTVSEPI